MNLEQKINEELKASIKKGDKLRMETLRSIRATIIEFNKSGIDREMNQDDEIKILKSASKKRKDAIEMYEKGGRPDLAEKEKQEMEIISEFLPKQLSQAEIAIVVSAIIEDLNASGLKDIGKVMASAMQQLKGKADGSLVQQIVKSSLENS